MNIQSNIEYNLQDPAPGEVAAEFSGVSKCYGQVPALNNVSFRMYPGELVSLLGANGAGKTTAVQLRFGLAAPNQGGIQSFGENPPRTQAQIRVWCLMRGAKG